MRTTALDEPVRLYHLDEEAPGGMPATLLYARLGEVLAMADAQPDEVKAGLYIQTRDDVIRYLELVGGD